MRNWIHHVNRSTDWAFLPQVAQWTVQQGLDIQQIPAPTFEERARAEYVLQQFEMLGLCDTDIDPVNNVYGRLPGRNPLAPAVMISAHTDTVFARATDLSTSSTSSTIHGPGLGDNSMGVAGLLGLAHALQQQEIMPEVDLWFVATSGEEGLGDLRGMRAAFARLAHAISTVINVEGLALGHIYHSGIAVKRLKITVTTEGGHSWLHFGRPNAIHVLSQLVTRISSIRPPTAPRTTYNVGMIEGGISVNTIAPSASLLLDMRSEQQPALDALEEQVRAHIRGLTTREQTFTIETVGNRPAGRISPEHALVQGAMAALEQVGLAPVLETGSTDGNIPLAAGCPTVTIGVTRGGNAHRTDEFIEVAPVESGIRQLITLALAAAYNNALEFTGSRA
jgi:acetylornithine deacetylase/succinyl-diaminopimelate desuccinylase-like protein